MQVEIITLFFVSAIFLIRGKLVMSDDEILKYLTLFLKKLILSISKGVIIKSILIFLQYLYIRLYSYSLKPSSFLYNVN